MKLKLLVIVPAYNEEKNIPVLLESILDQGDRYDVVVIDDGSRDQTTQIARAQGAKVIKLPVNLGIGGAMQVGFEYAVNYQYDIAIQIDGDGQHDPFWLDQLIEPINMGEANCVIGSRYTKEKPDRAYKTPFLRRLGMFFSTTVLFLATGKVIYDTTSGFRALDRRAFTHFASEYPVDHPEAEALYMLHRAGFKIKEIPVVMHQRSSGTSLFAWYKIAMYPFRVLLGFMELALKTKQK